MRGSTQSVPPPEPPEVNLTAPPSLHSATPPPGLTRRESKLLRKHSSPSHKRSATASSLLSFTKTPPKVNSHDGSPLQENEWEGVLPDSRADESPSPSRSPSMNKKRQSAPGSFRGFSFSTGVMNGRSRKSQSISSASSSSSGNSEQKKRVSWKLPTPQVMPPCHPLKPEDAPQIEKELALHFEALSTQDALPTVAPLRVNKNPSSPPGSSGGPLPVLRERPPASASPTPNGQRGYGAPLPQRPEYVEPWKQEPTQNYHPKYTTNPKPLPSPPNSGSEGEEAEAEILKDLGRRPLPKGPGDSEEITPVRKNNTKYGTQVQPPPPPVIGIVQAPSPPPLSAPRATVRKTNTDPAIPTISLPSDENSTSVPKINISNTASAPAVPTISFPENDSKPPTVPSVSVGGVKPQPGTRPLPQPHPRPSSVYSTASTMGRSRGPTATCNLCRAPIQGRIVASGSLRFHSECFRCDHCQTPLEHVGFYPEPAEHRRKRLEQAGINEDQSNGTGVRFYCHLDFHELFSPRCKSCKTPIEGEVVVACGNTWHQGHFFCAECGDPFDSNSKFVEKDGYAWCVPCYTKRYSGRCKKCKRPVTETVVKALGGEWHEECFVCTVSPALHIRPSHANIR
jgi:paxillin